MLRPLGDRVLVDLDGDEAFYGQGLIIKPDTYREAQSRGTVLAVGPGHVEKGKRYSILLEAGDRVQLNKFAPFTGLPLELDGIGTAYLVREADILGLLPDGEEA